MARRTKREPTLGPDTGETVPTVKGDVRVVAPKGGGKRARGKRSDANATRLLRPPLWKRALRRLLKWTVIVVVLAVLAPVGLTFLYAVPGVHPVSTLMAAQALGGEPMRRDWVDFENIAPPVWQSVVSSEDGQFCAHDGVDWVAVNQVIDDAMEGERVRGASTIPMQVVKNLYLWPSRSYLRKGLEVPLALLVDRVWTKRRTMEIYLNIAEWGPGIFGIEAAARHHFGRSAGKLTRRQAARLTVALPNPKTRNPARPGRGLERLARLVERRAKASGAYVKCLSRR